MKVYVINEDNHGRIGIAASRKAALQWLISSRWVGQYSEIWCPDKSEHWGGHWTTLDVLYGENWKEEFLQFSDKSLSHMDFFINEEEVFEGEDA